MAFQVDTAGTLETSLLAYYKLDSNSNDSKGSANGTDTSVSYGTGKVSNCATYNGSTSKSDLGANFDFERTDSFSVSFWIKFTDTGNKFIIGKQSTLSHTAKGWVIMCYLGCPYIQLNAGTSAGANELQTSTTGTDVINSGGWKHLVITYNGNSLSSGVIFYIDNSVITSRNIDFNNLSATIKNSVNARIGATSADSDFLSGSLDEIGIWNKVLSSQERTDLWNSGNGQTYNRPTLTLTETITHSDSFIRNTFHTLLETITSSDVIAKLKTQFKVLVETITLNAHVLKLIAKPLLETVTLTATFFRNIFRNLVETVTHSDVFSGVKILAKILIETITSTDVFLRSIYKSLTETVTLTGTFIKNNFKLFTETISISDTLALIKTFVLNFTETITHSDTFAKGLLAYKTATESISLTATFIKNNLKIFVETINLTATFSRIQAKIMCETVSLFETLINRFNGLFTAWGRSRRDKGAWGRGTRDKGDWTRTDRSK